MGLQTGTIEHSCRFRVPVGVPLGRYCLTVIANGIEASERKKVAVVHKRKWFKELKLEIKEKLETLEHFKEKGAPDIIDAKGIRENEIFERIEEEWVETMRLVAESLDAANEELGRAFIAPEERPDIRVPEPLVEEIVPIKISAAEARRGQEKHEDIRGQKVKVSKEAERIHDEIHGRHMPTTRDPAKKATTKNAAAKKATRRRAAPPPSQE